LAAWLSDVEHESPDVQPVNEKDRQKGPAAWRNREECHDEWTMWQGHRQRIGKGHRSARLVRRPSCHASLFDHLDTASFTYSFADIRGYGNSRGIDGDYTIGETASDTAARA
jgi:hypothetical protein